MTTIDLEYGCVSREMRLAIGQGAFTAAGEQIGEGIARAIKDGISDVLAEIDRREREANKGDLGAACPGAIATDHSCIALRKSCVEAERKYNVAIRERNGFMSAVERVSAERDEARARVGVLREALKKVKDEATKYNGLDLIGDIAAVALVATKESK